VFFAFIQCSSWHVFIENTVQHRNENSYPILALEMLCDVKECLISIASAFAMDARSQLRRSHNQEGVLPHGALRAPCGNTRKTHANAAGVSAQGRDEKVIGQRFTIHVTHVQ